MSTSMLGKWYLHCVSTLFTDPQIDYLNSEDLYAMYLLLEDDTTFTTYDSENTCIGNYSVEYTLRGNICSKGTFTFTNPIGTEFIRLCDSELEKGKLEKCKEVMNNLVTNKCKFQHSVKDNTLTVFNSKYLFVFKRDRIPSVNPPSKSFMGMLFPRWFS